MSELPQERQEQLETSYQERSEAGRPPYDGVQIHTRTEVEWILHKRGWSGDREPGGRPRADLRNADLSRAVLNGAQLWEANLSGANLYQARLNRAVLVGADLNGANLDGADLSEAGFDVTNLTGANLHRTDLRGAVLAEAKLNGADMRNSLMDASTVLRDIRFDAKTLLADVVWNGAPLTQVGWEQAPELGDEQVAVAASGREKKMVAYAAAARAYRQLAVALRAQGMNEDADQFAYRAQVLQRQVLRRQGLRKWPAYIGSLILDFISGYGYRPVRSFLVYLAAIVWFADVYHWLGSLPPLDATVFSMASFHGRGFFPSESFTLHSPVAIVAGVEAFFGLLIEITFIATFTQRFFAR